MSNVCRWAAEVPQTRRGHGDVCFPWRKAVLVKQLNPDLIIIICSGTSTPKWIDFCCTLFLTPFSAHSLFLCSMEHVGYCFSTILIRCEEKGNAHRTAAMGGETRQLLTNKLWFEVSEEGLLPCFVTFCLKHQKKSSSLSCLAFNALLVKENKSQRPKNQTKKEGISSLLLSGHRTDLFLLRWELGWKLDHNSPNSSVVLHDVWPAIMDQDGAALRWFLMK